jgi:hypothetical protein
LEDEELHDHELESEEDLLDQQEQQDDERPCGQKRPLDWLQDYEQD